MPKISAPTVEKHRERTTDALISAFDELVAERGYSSVSLGEIARHAGVSRTAIYNYAPNKAFLLLKSADRATVPLRRAVADVAADESISPPERITQTVRLMIGAFATSTQQLTLVRQVHGALIRSEADEAFNPFLTDIQRHLDAMIRAGVASGAFAPPVDLAVTVDLVMGAMETASLRIVDDPNNASHVADATALFVRRALAADQSTTLSTDGATS